MIDTKYITVDPSQPDLALLTAAAQMLQRGSLVAFPTETVYGLGANGLDAAAVARIFAAKGRPNDNPLILHIAAIAELQPLVTEINRPAQSLIEHFWPGPLTIILPRSELIPDAVTAGLDTVAVRMPQSVIARQLIALSKVPLAAPSANTSGRPSPTSAAAVAADLTGKIDMIIDGGQCSVGLESTVIDCTASVPTILRPGAITREMLLTVLPTVTCELNSTAATAAPARAPGMKYPHYAPLAPLIVVEHPYCRSRLMAAVASALAEGKRVGAIVAAETAELLPPSVERAVYGNQANVAQIAERLYNCLRHFDHRPVDVIFAEGIDEGGLGQAIMNRLRKAASSIIAT